MDEYPRVSVLQAHGFDPATGTWRPGVFIRSFTANRLTLVTCNLWFSEYRWRERIDALLKQVYECQPHVIGFQEVTPLRLERILDEDWVRRDYQVSDASGASLQPHGVLLLSRLPVSDLVLCHLPSRKHRKLVLGRLKTVNETICFGTVHLESSPMSRSLRLLQLDRVFSSLHEVRHAVLMGDFNFDPLDRAEQSVVERGFTDIGRVLHRGDPKYTVDSVCNQMRFRHKKRHERTRFDRILLRSPDAVWVPESVRLIGTQPISPNQPDVYPSDHFGLVGVIVRKDSIGCRGSLQA
jgi:tyrosyl-DNA phosphodiesterase 2